MVDLEAWVATVDGREQSLSYCYMELLHRLELHSRHKWGLHCLWQVPLPPLHTTDDSLGLTTHFTSQLAAEVVLAYSMHYWMTIGLGRGAAADQRRPRSPTF